MMLQTCAMRCFYIYLLLFSLFLFILETQELEAGQTQALLQIRNYLEYPSSLQSWENYNGDLCTFSSSPNVSIKCQDDAVIELKITGDKFVKPSILFNGFAVPNQTLSANFSIDTFFTIVTRLTSLRVLSLVSLGLWGPLPDMINRLSLVEVLDLSSNFLFGAIPPKISTMVTLYTVALDDNYFNATMPDWFGSLTNLTMLSLKNNFLKGSFPTSLCDVKTLEVISLSRNELSGGLPDLCTLSGLHVLDLRENNLNSQLPLLPKSVVTVLLSNNSLHGEIPEQYGELDQLQHLDLSSNHLNKIPLHALFSLPNISYLNLANNVLSGSLPDTLICGRKLGFVDISGNKLRGGLPSCLANVSDSRVVRYGGNCLVVDSQNQQRGSYCDESNWGWKRHKAWKVAGAVAIIVGFVLVISVAGIFLCKKCYSRKITRQDHDLLPKIFHGNTRAGGSSEILANARFISQTVKLGSQTTTTCRLFSIEELKEATRNFDISTYIGEGSIGKLYKGKLENGSHVVIRSLVLSKKCSIQNLRPRLHLLSKLQHPNLVTLLGHCIDFRGQDDSSGHRLHLVYEYVPNGNYRTYLSEKGLKWSDRLAILIGVAKAVHFLHTGVFPGCFNSPLESKNVLLDEHHIPKLSDYGMSIITEEIEKIEAKGEKPKSCQITKVENDVYNFGFILLESLVGSIASDKGETFIINEKASFGSQDGRRKIVDPLVLTTCSQESLSIAISITAKCISPESSSRPSFEDVLWNLQYAAQVQATADADQKLDYISQILVRKV